MRIVQDKREEQECYKLWKDCFGDSKQYMDYYFTEKTRDNEIYAIERDGEVISMLHLNPFSFSVNGETQRLHYIVGVATKEEERGQGLMRSVLTDTLRLQSKRGEAFTYLMPAAKEIYLPYEFRYVYTQKRVKGVFNPKEQDVKGVQPYDAMTPEKKPAVVSFVNENLLPEFDCYVLRDLSYYERLSLEMQAAGGNLVVFYKGDVLLGVCAFMLEAGHLEVVETVIKAGMTEACLTRMQGYIYENYGPEILKAVWLETHFLEEEMLKQHLEEPEEVEQPIIMARLLCVRKALEQLALESGIASVNARIKVEDPIIPENNQVFGIKGDQAGIQVDQEEEVLQAANVESDMVHVGIDELTEWYFGVRKIPELEGIKTVTAPYINDVV